MVPHVPPEMFFSHAGGRVLLRDDGSVSESPEAWTEFKESIWGWIGKVMGSVKLKLAGPHRLGSRNGYLQRLAKQVDVT